MSVIQQRLRKQGNSFSVTIPREVVDHWGIEEGQLLGIEITPLEVRPMLDPGLREAFEESWAKHQAGYRRLIDKLPDEQGRSSVP